MPLLDLFIRGRGKKRKFEPVSVGFEPRLSHHTRILKIGDQRLARAIGRMSPKIQKIAPQRFRKASLTCGNVAPIFAAEGKLKVLIDKVLPLEEARLAHEIVAGRSSIGKVVLTP